MTVVGIILVIIGLSALTGISFFNFIFAIILIVIGVRLVMGRSWRNAWHWDEHRHGYKNPSNDDFIDEVAVFSPLNKSYATEHFKGGKIVMVFSGGEIDLTQAKTDGTTIDLEVSSVFSGIEITVPKDWKVTSAVKIFAGDVDMHQAQGGDGPVTLTLRGDATFGHIEVRK
jgi:predicted membrane protein